MDPNRVARPIDRDKTGQAPKTPPNDLLPQLVQQNSLGIGNSPEANAMRREEIDERLVAVRANRNHFNPLSLKVGIDCLELNQLLATIGSAKSSKQNQKHRSHGTNVLVRNRSASNVVHRKRWQLHWSPPLPL